MLSSAPQKALILASLTVFVACKGEEKAKCQSQFAEVQKSMNIVKSQDVADLERLDGELAAAVSICEEAGVDQAVTELEKARKKIAKQVDRVKQRGNSPKKAKLTPEQLARLVKEGDPKCAKGQAYKHAASGKEIRCTGPLPIDMGRAAAEKYFVGRDYTVRPTDDKSVLKLEFGGELLLLTYSSESDPNPAKCITIYPPHGQSWQEAVSRFSGKNPALLRKGGSIKTKRGAMTIDIEEGKDKLVARIGDCDK